MSEPPSLPDGTSLVKVWHDYAASNGIWTNSVKKTKKDEVIQAATNWYNTKLVEFNDWLNSGAAELMGALSAEIQLSDAQVDEFVDVSGVSNLADLVDLDVEGLKEVLDQCKFKAVVASRIRKFVVKMKAELGKDEQLLLSKLSLDDSVVQKESQHKRTGKLVDPDKFPDRPTARQYKVWRDSIDDWHHKLKPRFVDDDLYLAVQGKIAESDKANFQSRYPKSDDRNLDKLLSYLDDVHKKDPEREDQDAINRYRKCTRQGRGYREFRMKWEESRQQALATGRITVNARQDLDDFVQAAELDDRQTVSYKVELAKAMKAHEDSCASGALAAGTEFDCLKWMISDYYHHLETTSTGQEVSGNRGKRQESTAAFSNSGNKGGKKGKSGGKGGKKGRGRSSSPSPAFNREGSKPPTVKRRPPCPKGADCPYKDSCQKWHPGERAQKRSKSAGPAKRDPSKGPARPGGFDRLCVNPECKAMVFGSKTVCFKCGTQCPKAEKPMDKSSGR